MPEKCEKKEKEELIYQMKSPSFWKKLLRVVVEAVAMFITNLPHEDEWERKKVLKILVVEPLKAPYAAEIDGSLESMQNIVGGLIQVIYLFEDPEIALVCNDEGKLLGLPLNRLLTDGDGRAYDIICGIFFLCAAPADSDSFESLTEAQIREYTDYYMRQMVVGV